MLVKFPENSFFEDLLKKAIKIKEKVTDLWKEIDKETDSDDKVNIMIEQAEELEKSMGDCLSLYAIVNVLDKDVERKESEQYDVTKVYISEENLAKMKKNDTEVAKLMFDYMKEEKIAGEVSMFYFMSGLSTDPDLNNESIDLREGFLREVNK